MFIEFEAKVKSVIITDPPLDGGPQTYLSQVSFRTSDDKYATKESFWVPQKLELGETVSVIVTNEQVVPTGHERQITTDTGDPWSENNLAGDQK